MDERKERTYEKPTDEELEKIRDENRIGYLNTVGPVSRSINEGFSAIKDTEKNDSKSK